MQVKGKLVSSGIYLIKNLTNSKRYIGSSNDLFIRHRAHRNDLRRGNHHSIVLQRAWDKYGEDAFEFEIAEYVSGDDLVKIEQKYLDELKPEYNICKIAGNCTGRKLSQESIEKIRQSKLGVPIHTKEHKAQLSKRMSGEGNHFHGCKHSKESRRKIKEARAKQVFTEATRANLSKSCKGANNPAAKPVIAINVNTGDEVRYEYVSQAKLDGFPRTSSITACCRGEQESYKGFNWKYA